LNKTTEERIAMQDLIEGLKEERAALKKKI
jgi:hypothetical protein